MNPYQSLYILLSIAFVFLAISCNKVPETDFTFTPTENPEAGDVIDFQNTTTDGSSFSWTFGDGGISSVENPSHIFEAAGNFDVTLTATNDAGDQAKTKVLAINEPTNLSFVVWDSTETILLAGAEVWLFDNQSDWDKLEEPMLIGVADAEGEVIFRNMDPIVYYIWALKEEPGGLWVSGGWTPAIAQNETSLFNVPCVWLPDEAKKATSNYPESVVFTLRVQ